jgi:hypothetical protein
MDWNKVRDSPREPAGGRLDLVDTCWRMRSLQKSTRILSCGIHRTNAPGLEVRAGYSEEDLLRSQRTADIGCAREIAEGWRQAVIAKGGFEELTREETRAISDAAAEEGDYLCQRISELRKAGARLEPEIDAQLTREVTDALRGAGHETLLLRYMAGLQWFNRTRAELERANADGLINETAQEAMNNALEDFERVEAEVLDVFDQLDERKRD